MQESVNVSVSLDSRLIEKIKFDQDKITIGRDAKNDILINNLAVSRFHAEIYRDGSNYSIKDLGSANGTFINGQKVEWAEVNAEDVILVGKHILKLEHQKQSVDEAYSEGHTVMVDAGTQDKFIKQMETHQSTGKSKIILSGGAEVPVDADYFTIGKDPENNVNINGIFVKSKHALIIRQSDGRFRIISSGSIFKPTKVNGNKVSEKILINGDIIQIGNHKMVFIV